MHVVARKPRFASSFRQVAFVALALVASWLARAEGSGMVLTEIAPGIFVHNGVQEDASRENGDEIANIGFIIGTDAVAVVDPGGSYREGVELRKAIRARTELPIRYVILSHVHPDHIFGAAAFREGNPDFIGHAKLPGALAQRGGYYFRRLQEALGSRASGTEVMAPTVLVSNRLDIDLGRRRLVVEAHGPAHTDTDLTIFDENTETFWLSDLLFVERIPVIDGSLLGWLAELRRAVATKAARAVPGHGPVSVSWPEAAAPEQRYLDTVARDTRVLIKAGAGIADAYRQVAQSERGRWLLFDDYHARNVTAAFKELEWE
jgi:quinoprotein relay system zinc metallohydrolase 2